MFFSWSHLNDPNGQWIHALYDVSNDVMKSAILKISNDDISGTSRSTSCLIHHHHQSMMNFNVV